MTVSHWRTFPYEAADYDYSPEEQAEHWSVLHAGDREPLPAPDWIKVLFKDIPRVADEAGVDAQAATEQLLTGWGHFHRGDFAAAAEVGESLGLVGATLWAKAQATYAHYLETDKSAQRNLLMDVADRMDAMAKAMPGTPNAYYHRAFALGRYSQVISVAEALKQGVAGHVKTSLEAVLDREPDHADAHTALGTYHAEIIDKMGAMFGGVTYGANRDEGLAHYQRGIELAPHSISALTEYADGLLMMYGKKKVSQATELYQRAVALDPYDALSHLDWVLAKEELS